MQSIEKAYETSVENLETSKNYFHHFAKNAEESKIMAELYKERNDKNLSGLIKEEETKMLDNLKNNKMK